jgi:HD-GYP domain-containing protein (c-di-GMP phosphodiesterase class II)
MLKKIPTSELRIGMYVHDLGRAWMDHPFSLNRFLIKDRQTLQKIIDAGIRVLTIDASKGLAGPAPAAVGSPPVQSVPDSTDVKPDKVSVAEERGRAKVLFQEATSIIHALMSDARLGKQVEVQSLEPLAERMVKSTLRSRHALTGISRIKTKDEYTFMHCVSVAGLMTTFAIEMALDERTIHQVALGGMLHDIGKTLVPDEILNKPGKLDDDEFVVMRKHVEFSGELLQDQVGLSQIARDVAMLHHERMDGKGYPLGLSGERISLIGQMSAIVDVYDALTSVRVYKAAWEPSLTLKKLLEWSPHHFNPALVQRFIKCLGIYPVGSLVELESGRVGVVMEQGQDMLRPLLRIIYHARQRAYVKVRDLDLAKETTDRIVNVRSPADFKLDLSMFV